MPLNSIFSVAACFLLLVLSACRPQSVPQTPALGEGNGVAAFQAVSDLAVGEERFAFALLAPDGSEFVVETLDTGLYFLEAEQPELKATAPASYEKIVVEVPHQHQGGEVHIHQDVRGVYILPKVAFDRAGRWGLAITPLASSSGPQKPVTLEFQVKEKSFTPAIGEPAPASVTATASTDEQLSSLCSRLPPDDMHQVSIDQSVMEGRPFVVVFASPSFCQSRLCGPITDLVLSLEDKYQDRLDFIHVEPYDLELAREEGRLELTATSKEWGLHSEPWVFIVDKQGNVAAKFEGILSRGELEEAIQQALPSG